MKPQTTPHKRFRIGIDVMGSDCAPSLLLDALEKVSFPLGIEPLIFATKQWIRSSLPCIETETFIEMEEKPLAALRRKKGASMIVGLKALQEGKIDAFLSMGNTGAFIAAAKTVVKMQPGYKRLALTALIPTLKEPAAVLDLGANLEVSADSFVEFAFLGTAYQKARGLKNIRVGLLNIGSEPIKGTKIRQDAYQKLVSLQNPHFTFIGNVEGRTVFEGEVDVLLTDGFSGNIFLKTAEGLASLILSRLQTTIAAPLLEKIAPQLTNLKQHLYSAEHPGAIVAGLKGLAIKCHGHMSPESFGEAARKAGELVQGSFYPAFERGLAEIFLWKKDQNSSTIRSTQGLHARDPVKR